MRPADPSHGQGRGANLLPHCPSHLTHSPCVRMPLSLSLPHTLTPRPATPSPSLPWERVHPAGLRGERPKVPIWGEKRGEGRNSTCWGPPRSSVGKDSACSAGDLGPIPGSERSPGEGNGYPLQCSCLENPMDRGAWQATVHGVARVGHNLVTQPPPPIIVTSCFSHQNMLTYIA